MNAQHINKGNEVAKILQALPTDVKHLVIDAVGSPVGSYYPETLTDYVHRIQNLLIRA